MLQHHRKDSGSHTREGAPVWRHCCLKRSQTDFVWATGVATHLGNSGAEFADISSCITCQRMA
ncbi:hypothetical protein ELI13_34630 [Rhizobium ruizarguesonis]|nr:hypothetical protein ELI13_34630 [Rhizobium ruizarguesonis]